MAAHGAEFTGFDQPKIKQQKKNRGRVSLKLNRKKKKKRGNETIIMLPAYLINSERVAIKRQLGQRVKSAFTMCSPCGYHKKVNLQFFI